MAGASPPVSGYGLEDRALRPGEAVLHRWVAPRGQGVLTNYRFVLLGRPAPFRRKPEWSRGLEEINSLAVERVQGLPARRVRVRGGFAGGVIGPVRIDATFSVNVDHVPVYIGDPNRCGEIQQWIDDARTSRCVALYGRALPFGAAAPPPGAAAASRV